MNEIFLVFLSLSLSGSLIAAVLFFIRPLIHRHLSRAWQYYIYLVVILRLLIPIGSDSSIMGRMFTQLQEGRVDEKILSDETIAENLLTVQDSESQLQTDETLQTGQPLHTKADITGTILEWLWIVWLLPAVILLLRKITGYIIFVNSIKRKSHRVEQADILILFQKTCEQMNICQIPNLLINDQAASPMLVGFIHPAVILPDTEINSAQMQYVFQHELTHYRRLDLIYKWLVQTAVCLHWYNPLVYRISRRINWNCELACDEAVIKRLDHNQKYNYGDMLLGSIRIGKLNPSSAITVTLSEDTKMLKERLYAIKQYKHKTRTSAVLAVILSVCLLGITACTGAYTTQKGTSGLTESPSSATEKSTSTTLNKATEQAPATVDEMSLTYYEDDDPDGRWPYLHWIVSNHSDQAIVDYEMACLPYDKDGNPLELVWYRLPLTDGSTITGYNDQSEKAYEHTISMSSETIAPGMKQDLQGGWSLFDGWNQADGTHVVEHVITCLKSVTFEDGSVWKNPEYGEWIAQFKEKKVDLAEL